MTVRTRILVACLAAAILPLVTLAVGARHTVRERLAAQYRDRVAVSEEIVRDALAAESAGIASRLLSLAQQLTDDPSARAALLERSRRRDLIDYAPGAMPSSGLDYLLLLDGDGTVLSSGHFRNEFDRSLPLLPAALRAADGPVILAARRAAGSFTALALARPIELAGNTFTFVGGVELDSAYIAQLAGGWSDALGVRLDLPGSASASESDSASAIAARLPLPFIDVDAAAGVDASGTAPGSAAFVITHSLEPIRAVLRELDRWFIAALFAAVLLAAVLARVLAARVNRPLEDLALAASRIELGSDDVAFATQRDDEIGTLSRLLDRMIERLRAGARELRDAERRATVGDMARQVNHDIRNGLLPIRNVIHHLAEVAQTAPSELGTVFAERADTLEGGIGYLESLAVNYARLTPRGQKRACNVNAILEAIHRDATWSDPNRIALEPDPALPAVAGDPVALRRVFENLVINAVESLPNGTGRVTVRTQARGPAADRRVIVTIADTGAGIAPDRIDRIFDDFYTTKPRGTGLGLSIVRRLVTDTGGRISVNSVQGRGTTFTIEFPAMEHAAS